VMDVQKARGIPVDSKNIVTRLMNTIPVFVPVIIRALSYAWDLSIVLSVRGFGSSKTRTFYFKLKWKRSDTISLAILIVFYTTIIALKLSGFSTYYFLKQALSW